MLIANPIYDVVFKYLMANLEIAKGVISTIINEEIVSIDFKAQEHVHRFKSKALESFTIKDLLFFHLDFVAKISVKGGGYKNVLIELQKTNLPYDIERFRKYLGAQYQRVDEVHVVANESSKESLPIITIYFLGFNLSNTLPSVIKVNREYIDVLENRVIHERSEFIEQLTHDSYVIQIPQLHVELKSKLESILSVFQQEHFIGNTRYLKSYDYEVSDDLTVKILKQLEKAAGDEQLYQQLEVEEMALSEYESTFTEFERRLEKTTQELEKKKQVIEETTQELEKKKQVIEEKDHIIEQKEQLIKTLLEKLNKLE